MPQRAASEVSRAWLRVRLRLNLMTRRSDGRAGRALGRAARPWPSGAGSAAAAVQVQVPECQRAATCLASFQQVPWTGQPIRNTGLERLGFYGDAWATLRAGLRTALRTGPPGRATLQAAGPYYAQGRRVALRVGPQASPLAGPSAASPRRWTLGQTDGADTYQWTSRPRAPGVYSRIHVPYAGTTLGGSDSGCWSLLHTAGPENSGRVIRLHLLGSAACRGGRINVGQPWMERVEAGTAACRARTGRDLDVGFMGK